jgi:hypothetical protein
VRSQGASRGCLGLGPIGAGPRPWETSGLGPSIYLHITRCKLICLARKNTCLLPSKTGLRSSGHPLRAGGEAREQDFWEQAGVWVRQGCHLQGVSLQWAPEPAPALSPLPRRLWQAVGCFVSPFSLLKEGAHGLAFTEGAYLVPPILLVGGKGSCGLLTILLWDPQLLQGAHCIPGRPL